MRLPGNSDWTAWHRFCFGRPPGPLAAPAAADGGDGVSAMAVDGADAQQPTLPLLLSMEPVGRRCPRDVCKHQSAIRWAPHSTAARHWTLTLSLTLTLTLTLIYYPLRYCLNKPSPSHCGSGGWSNMQVLATDLLQRHVRWAIDAGPLSPQSASWLYALTARLERPLTQDVMASMRALLKHCARVRCVPRRVLIIDCVLPTLLLLSVCLPLRFTSSQQSMLVSSRAAVTMREDPSLTNLNIMIAIAGGYFKQDEELATVYEA